MKKNLLVQRRKALGLSQEKLADLIEVDVSTIRRWEAGGSEPQPLLRPRLAAALKISVETLAALFGHMDELRPEFLSISIPVDVIWPELREGDLSAHPHPWVAERTLKELAILVRCDMLTRRETLTSVVRALPGAALLAPIEGWLDAPPTGLEPREDGVRRIGVKDVETIERSTRFFAATDAEVGGALSREAAVGQLKYAVDLARDASYSEATGHRLLAVIAELSGLVGWLCHDSGMPGPAQRYFTYGLQAARESADPRAPLLVVSILADMGQQMRWLGRSEAALRLHELAIRQIPRDRRRFNVLRAVLAGKRAEDGLAPLGPSRLTEVRSAVSLSFDLYSKADDHDRATAATLWHRALDMSEAELSMAAAAAFMTLAPNDSRLAVEAEKYTFAQLAKVPEGQGRAKVFGQIRLARLRLLAGEAEQACDDGDQAIRMAEAVSSAMIQTKLRDLLADSEPYSYVPRVVEFRDRLRTTIAALN